MAASDDIRGVHERIDELIEKVGKMDMQLGTFITTWELCRVIVLGNGGTSIDKRVDRLEVAAKEGTRRYSFVAGAAVTLLTAIVGAAAGAYFATN